MPPISGVVISFSIIHEWSGGEPLPSPPVLCVVQGAILSVRQLLESHLPKLEQIYGAAPGTLALMRWVLRPPEAR